MFWTNWAEHFEQNTLSKTIWAEKYSIRKCFEIARKILQGSYSLKFQKQIVLLKLFTSKCSAQNILLIMFWKNLAEHFEQNILSSNWSRTVWAKQYEQKDLWQEYVLKLQGKSCKVPTLTISKTNSSAQNVQLKMFCSKCSEQNVLNKLSWTFWAEHFEVNILSRIIYFWNCKE